MARRRSRALIVGAASAVVLVGAGLLTAWVWSASVKKLNAELNEARAARSAGRTQTAARQLGDLARRWPNRSEVHYELGLCERDLGRADEAISSFERVDPRSPIGLRAIEARVTLLTNLGRFGEAEHALANAPNSRREGAYELARSRSRLFRLQCRVADVRRVLRESFDLAPPEDRVERLRELWLLDTTPFPIDGLRMTLGQLDPTDPGVALALANLALLSGQLDEASRLIEQCRSVCPADDPALARTELDLARERDDPAGVVDAMNRLPGNAMNGTEVGELRAWIGARIDDLDVERRVLLDLIDRDPRHPMALERLAALASRAGSEEEAARYRGLKAEVDRARDRYRALLLTLDDPAAEADTLARLCEAIGRPFDAAGWRSIDGGPLPSAEDFSPDSMAGHDAPASLLLGELLAFFPPRDGSLVMPDHRERRTPAPGPTPPRFADEAESRGLSFRFDAGHTGLRQLPETMSGGLALLDYDGDGFLDVYFIQGGRYPPDPDSEAPGDRLFRNLGDGTFEDVTEAAGFPASSRGYGHGVTVGDIDNDGYPDLFVTRWRSYELWRNTGDGTFEDITESSGLGGDRDWPSSSAFADLDGDGDLDLFVCQYLEWDEENPPLCRNDDGTYFYCDPVRLRPLVDRLYWNDGGVFVDVTEGSGIDLDEPGRALGVVAADLDGDGLVDLYVANDGTANFLFRNLGDLRFEEVGHESGLAGNAEGGFQAGMGVACGDLDGDGLIDLAVTNFYGEGTTLYANLGGGFFADRSADFGLLAATRLTLGFGIAFLDYDNDGRLDLLQVNGHVNDGRPNYPYALPPLLLANLGGGRLADVSRNAGPPWTLPRLSRGLAVGDFDNNGCLDAIIISQNDPVSLFANRTEAGHFVTFLLQGTASNRDAIGAVITVDSGGRRLLAPRLGGGSYQSSGDPRLHFGLGAAADPVSIEVRWPSGQIDTYEDLPVDTAYRLIEGDAAALPLEGWPASP